MRIGKDIIHKLSEITQSNVINLHNKISIKILIETNGNATKEFILAFYKAAYNQDIEKLETLTDDNISVNMVGVGLIKGKEEYFTSIRTEGSSRIIEVIIERIICEINTVVVENSVKLSSNITLRILEYFTLNSSHDKVLTFTSYIIPISSNINSLQTELK